MLTKHETDQLTERLDALEVRALEITGAEFALAEIKLTSKRRRDFKFKDLNKLPYLCRVGLGPVNTSRGKLYPQDVEVYGTCPLSAIEAAYAELKARTKQPEAA